MSELGNSSIDKTNANSELGKNMEKLAASSQLEKAAENTNELSEDDLNAPIEEFDIPEMDSCDCRSECKYNTGNTAKSSNYGYSG